jgi:hypothetical protein
MILRRSSNAISLYARNTHLSVFKPAKTSGMYSEWGFHLKHRRRSDGTWLHTVVRLFERAKPIPGARGCWKWEAQQYRTRSPKGLGTARNRVTIKRFVRLKVGLGGVRT